MHPLGPNACHEQGRLVLLASIADTRCGTEEFDLWAAPKVNSAWLIRKQPRLNSQIVADDHVHAILVGMS